MARIRSIHPGLWTDECFVSMSRDARLLFVGLLNECDDYGAFECKPLQIKMKLCAADDVTVATISTWLEEMVTAKMIQRYEISGTNYGAVRNFRQWQRPKKPNQTYPMSDEIRTYTGLKTTEFGTGSPPNEHDPPDVPHHTPTSGENPPQMEEEEEEIKGGDKGRGGGGESPRERANGAAAPPRPAAEKAISPDWLPDPEALTYADRALGPDDAEREVEKFIRHYAGRPTKRRGNWNPEFKNWVDHEIQFRQRDGRTHQ